jgi:hypothetical protein
MTSPADLSWEGQGERTYTVSRVSNGGISSARGRMTWAFRFG